MDAETLFEKAKHVVGNGVDQVLGTGREVAALAHNVVDEVRNPQKLSSDVAGLKAVFSMDGGGEQIKRLLGVHSRMDEHRDRASERAIAVADMPIPKSLDRSEREFLASYKYVEGTKAIQEWQLLQKEGHGAGLVATLANREIEQFKTENPHLGKVLDKVLDKVDWKELNTVFDPAHAEHATNAQGVLACVALAADVVPIAKVEEFAGKAALKAEGGLAKAAEHKLAQEMEHDPARFIKAAEGVMHWANKHLPPEADKAFDKILEKLVDQAKKHDSAEIPAAIGAAAAPEKAQMAKLGDAPPGLHTGKVIAVDGDVAIQRVGDRYLGYNIAAHGGDIGQRPTPGAIETLGAGKVVPVAPKIEAAIAALDKQGAHLPPLGNLQQREPGAKYSGTLQHLDGDTYFMSTGRGEYVVFDAKADLHLPQGHHPPAGPVTIGGDGKVAPSHTQEHALSR